MVWPLQFKGVTEFDSTAPGGNVVGGEVYAFHAAEWEVARIHFFVCFAGFSEMHRVLATF